MLNDNASNSNNILLFQNQNLEKQCTNNNIHDNNPSKKLSSAYLVVSQCDRDLIKLCPSITKFFDFIILHIIYYLFGLKLTKALKNRICVGRINLRLRLKQWIEFCA